jgi:GNAT superfamily N-acetyltransferase
VRRTEPAALLPWDTEFWGVRIGRVEGDTMTAERAAELEDWAAAHEVACVYFLAGEDAATAHAAEDAGFRLMDVRVGLARAAAPAGVDARVRALGPGDLPALREIARASHGATRFYADPRFPRERCDDLYDVWITRSAEGWAEAVLVAEHDGSPAAYLSCHADEARGRASIGLFAVAEAARGSGLGAALVEAAVCWAAERGLGEIDVVTQGRSAAALRVYERRGFVVESLGFWFHRWYDVGEPTVPARAPSFEDRASARGQAAAEQARLRRGRPERPGSRSDAEDA